MASIVTNVYKPIINKENDDTLLPFFLYLKNEITKKHFFLEINSDYVINNFSNPKNVNKEEIIKKLLESKHTIIYESQLKTNVFKTIKTRYEQLLEVKRECNDIEHIFNEYPEYNI